MKQNCPMLVSIVNMCIHSCMHFKVRWSNLGPVKLTTPMHEVNRGSICPWARLTMVHLALQSRANKYLGYIILSTVLRSSLPVSERINVAQNQCYNWTFRAINLLELKRNIIYNGYIYAVIKMQIINFLVFHPE